MRMLRGLLLAVLFCGAGAIPLAAQTRADSAAVLLNAAEQLRLRGETEAARAVLDLIARQFAGTPAAQQVSAMRTVLRRTPEAERSGRTELLVFGTLYGSWLGVAVPLAFDANDPEAYGIGLLAGAPIGFLAARQYASSKMPTRGQSRALTFGGLWGTANGIALVELFDIKSREDTICPTPDTCETYPRDPEARTYITAAVLGGLAGIGTGAFLARKPITAGTAATATLGGMWGSWFGFALSFLADQRDDDLLAGTMIGGNGSLLALGLLAPRWQMSESRARLISVGGIIGGLAGAGTLLLVQPDDESTAIAVPLTTSALGLGLAAYWTRNRDLPQTEDGRGALINRSGGSWGLDVPDASLMMQRDARGDLRPAAYVPLLRARF